MDRLIRVDQWKWPDREHYQYEVVFLGRDEHGCRVSAPPGTVVSRGREEPWELPGGMTSSFPAPRPLEFDIQFVKKRSAWVGR